MTTSPSQVFKDKFKNYVVNANYLIHLKSDTRKNGHSIIHSRFKNIKVQALLKKLMSTIHRYGLTRFSDTTSSTLGVRSDHKTSYDHPKSALWSLWESYVFFHMVTFLYINAI